MSGHFGGDTCEDLEDLGMEKRTCDIQEHKKSKIWSLKSDQTRLKDLEIVGSCETTELCFFGNQMLRHTIFRSKATSQGNVFSLSQRLSKIKQISKWLKTQSLCKPVILTTLAEN